MHAEKVGRVGWTEANNTRVFTTCPPYYLLSVLQKRWAGLVGLRPIILGFLQPALPISNK